MSKVEITGAQYPLHKVFSSDFVFTIPPYQRPYSWKIENATALLEDLIAHMGDSNEPIEQLSPYFLGTIVLIKKEGPESEVVDGQQRLTTLTILLSVLRRLVSAEIGDALTRRLYDPADALLNTRNRYRLTLRKEDSDFFQIYIQMADGLDKLPSADEVLEDSKRNLRDNAVALRSILERIEPIHRDRLARLIISRCYVVVVSTSDLDSAYRIFSVLNDRGLDLSHTDILKAETIGAIVESERELYTDKWVREENELGREHFEALFGHIRMVHAKVKAKTTILKEFRDSVGPSRNPKQFIDEVLVPMAIAFDEILHASYESKTKADRINGILRWLNRIENSDWIPPAISFLAKYRGDPDRIYRFIVDLERLAAYLMISRSNINYRIDRYGQVLHDVETGADLHGTGSSLQLTTEERSLMLNLLNGPIYTEIKIRLYVLLRLDTALANGEATYDYPTISVEHILPQNPASDSKWLTWWPDEAQRYSSVHRLGNLALLSRRKNSQAQNFDFDRKKQEYFSRKGVSPFALTTQVLSQTEWTPEVVELRQRELVSKLAEVWRLGSPSK